MKKVKLTVLALLLFVLFAALPAALWAGGGQQGGGAAKPANLVLYLYGSEGVANKDILAAINAKLVPDINATLEVKYIDWGDTATKYPLIFASGEAFDMAFASPNTAAPYYTLASQGALAEITPLLDKTPVLKAAIPQATWDGAKVNGKIYAVPCLYSEFTQQGYVYSRNLLQKYGLPAINSIATMEAYMDAVVKNEKFKPLNGNSGTAQSLYRMFTDLTGGWLSAPGIPNSQMYLVCTSPDNYRDIIHPAFTQEFMDWAVRMSQWSAKGYWEPDILSASIGGKDNFNNGNSGGFITHQPDWTGNYGALKEKQPDVITDFWCFGLNTHKIVRKLGIENATVISVNSKNQETALKAIEKLMTDESYYDLFQYGIKGREYDVVNGVAVKPPTYNADKDAGGFAAWAFRNDKFNIPYATEDPRRYTLNAEWDKIAINNPYVGFSFNPQKVSTEIASITNVNSQLGIQIMLGKTADPKAAVEDYRNQLKRAGIDKVIAEVKSQLANFTPLGK